MTKKEKRREYREANKEKIAAQQKIRNKRYAENNKEKKKADDLAYRLKNNDKIINYRKSRLDNRDGLFTVYYLKEENYVGQTIDLVARLRRHKSRFNKHVLDVETLGRFETREEALAFEAKLHDMGYHGKNNGL